MSAGVINVLMIEDLKIAQIVAFNIFKQLNCRLTIVTHAARAIEQILAKRYDIIFIDIQLPDINGFELAQTIRNFERPRIRVPLIAVTANSTEDLASQARMHGFDDHLLKPLTIESVRSILSKNLYKTNAA